MNRTDFIKTSTMGCLSLLTVPDTFTGIQPTATSESPKIKIGQIGVVHSHAGARLKTLKKLSDVFELVGVVDDRNTKAARHEESDMKPFENVKWMAQEELLATPGLQAVMIERANTELVPTSLLCMERNLAISMDKPGGEDLSLFKKLLDGCRKRKLPFQIAYMLRTNPAIHFIKKAVREGWLGDVFEIRASMSHNSRGESYQKYFSHYPGGNMFILGCHHIDWIVSLLGRPKTVVPFFGATAGALHGAKNNCMVVMQYPQSIVSIHVCDMEVDGDANRSIKICGTNGTIELRRLERFDGKGLSLELRLKDGAGGYAKGSHTVDFEPLNDRYEAQLMEFARMIRGEAQSPYTLEHDYLTQEVHLAASGYTQWK